MSWEPDLARALRENAKVRRAVRRIKSWAGHPMMEHHKWQFAALGLVILVAVPWGLRAEEHALEDAAVAALGDSGVAVVDVSFNGRNAFVTAPTGSTGAVETALAGVPGIRKVEVVAGTLPIPPAQPESTPVTSPPSTTAAPTTTSTTAVPASARLTFTVGDDTTMSGTLTDAAVIARLGREADFVYRGAMTNQLLLDATLPAPTWQESASDVLRLTPWLAGGVIELDDSGVSVTGVVIDEARRQALLAALQTAVGADVPLVDDVTVATGAAPSLTLVTRGDTVDLRGTFPDQQTVDAIIAAVTAARPDATITTEMVVGANTPSTYLTRQTPSLIRLLGRANEFTLRYDEGSVQGAVVRGGFFSNRAIESTGAMQQLVDALAAMLTADPTLTASIEVHSASAADDAANLELTEARLTELLLGLVRAGIDPERLELSPGDGAGELLRFTLTTAENK